MQVASATRRHDGRARARLKGARAMTFSGDFGGWDVQWPLGLVVVMSWDVQWPETGVDGCDECHFVGDPFRISITGGWFLNVRL